MIFSIVMEDSKEDNARHFHLHLKSRGQGELPVWHQEVIYSVSAQFHFEHQHCQDIHYAEPIRCTSIERNDPTSCAVTASEGKTPWPVLPSEFRPPPLAAVCRQLYVETIHRRSRCKDIYSFCTRRGLLGFRPNVARSVVTCYEDAMRRTLIQYPHVRITDAASLQTIDGVLRSKTYHWRCEPRLWVLGEHEHGASTGGWERVSPSWVEPLWWAPGSRICPIFGSILAQ